MIVITEAAKKYLDSVRGDDYISLAVQGGGCAGFQYVWGLKSDHPNVEWSDPIDNTVVVDPVAEMYVLGSVIDYVTELGGSFLTVKIPCLLRVVGVERALEFRNVVYCCFGDVPLYRRAGYKVSYKFKVSIF